MVEKQPAGYTVQFPGKEAAYILQLRAMVIALGSITTETPDADNVRETLMHTVLNMLPTETQLKL